MHSIERDLAAIPGCALRIYQGALFENSLKTLANETGQSDPDWLSARVENMLLSNGTALVQMRALYVKAEALLMRYRQLPDADPLKITSFEVSCLHTINRQMAQLEENEKRFRQLLKAIREAKKQRSLISLTQLMKQLSS